MQTIRLKEPFIFPDLPNEINLEIWSYIEADLSRNRIRSQYHLVMTELIYNSDSIRKAMHLDEVAHGLRLFTKKVAREYRETRRRQVRAKNRKTRHKNKSICTIS